MGIVRALQKGDMKPSQASGKAKEMAKSMKKGDVKDFASTKHKGLPKKVKKEDYDPTKMYVVLKPMDNLDAAGLIKELNPLEGIQPLNIMQDDVHSVVTDETEAQRIAAEVYEAYCKQVEALEEKKGAVGNKIKKSIDQLEKKRKEHLDMAKEDPKNASKHKEEIAKLATQIDDLMSKMERIEKSKKNVEKVEDKKKDKLEEEFNPTDKVVLDVPLFIRLLEYAREDAKSDMDLHNVAQKAIELSQSGMTLSMKDYASLVGDQQELQELDPVNNPVNPIDSTPELQRDLKQKAIDLPKTPGIDKAEVQNLSAILNAITNKLGKGSLAVHIKAALDLFNNRTKNLK
jgi:uncharacterized protein (UPF0335 family)